MKNYFFHNDVTIYNPFYFAIEKAYAFPISTSHQKIYNDMEHYEEHHEGRNVIFHQELVITNENGERIPIDFQPTFDVLKSVGLDKHISENERRFLHLR